MLTRFRAASLTFAVLLLICLAAGAEEKPGSGFSSGAALPIGEGDLVQMTVLDTPELSGSLRVNNAGNVSVPLVGSVHLAGLTVEEAQALIRQRLMRDGFLKNPEVTLYIAEYATQGVAVLGEVKKPGIYPIFGSHRLLDYIALAEGLTPMGGTTVTVTGRNTTTPPRRVNLTTKTSPTAENNPEILPGDTIFVEKAGIVYVVGDVGRPGGFSMNHDERLTLLQALALAEGINRTAAQGAAKLIRHSAAGRHEIPLNLKKVVAGKTPDLPLQDEDIVFVPSSLGKSAAKRGLEAAVQAAVGVTIYRR